MAENLQSSESVLTANMSESPKFACFELLFESNRKVEGMKVCKYMPANTSSCYRSLPTLESLQQKQCMAQERRKKRVERQVTKARSRQDCAQKLVNVGAKLRQDGKSKRNHSESSDSCSSEEKENVSSSTCARTPSSERNGCQSSVAFEVPIGPPGSYRKTLPKRLCNRKRISTPVSIEKLKEKQQMAEIRKKQLEEARLKRIKDRQESARKLAESVEVLLQQRSLASGQQQGNAQLMSRREVMAAAHRVAQQFSSLSNQMRRDFLVEWKYKTNKNNNSKPKLCSKEDHYQNKSEGPSQADEKSPRSTSMGVAFSVDLYPDKSTNCQTPKKPASPQKTKKKTSITAEDVEEKLMKAEERRIKRREEKVKRVIANREALLKLSSNIETLLNDQEKPTDSQRLSRQEVANLANEIANGFDRLSERYRNDLKRVENFPTVNFCYMP